MSSTAQHARTSGRRPGRRTVLTVVGLTGAVVAAGTVLATRPSSAERICPAGAALVVAVPPELAPTVTTTAATLERPGAPGCPLAQVVARRSADIAGELHADRRPPDVWIADSSVWLDRTRRSSAGIGSVASSPVVLVTAAGGRVPPPPTGASGDFSVLAPEDGHRPLTLDLADPQRSSVSTATLVALLEALRGRADARRALAGLLEQAQTRDAAVDSSTALQVRHGVAVPTTEQHLFAARRASHPDVLALYATGAGSVLDYPFAVLTPDLVRQQLAERLLAALRAPAGRSAVRAAGFRDSTGAAGPELRRTPGVDADRPGRAPLATRTAVEAAQTAFTAVRQPARLLAVVDVSGSMATPVPAAGGITRLQLAQRAAARGLMLYGDSSAVGLWEFSTYVDGSHDHREVAPVAELGAAGAASGHRARLATALAGLRPTSGDTGLYDTTLAAVRAQQRSWLPGRTNAVLLLTDGRNDDPGGGVSLEQLRAALAAERDPHRPVPVIAIAYGPDSDAAPLRQISAATGGATYSAADPVRIEQVFFDALGQRACRPRCGPAQLP